MSDGVLLQPAVKQIQYVSFVRAPQGGDEQAFRPVPGQPVNDDVGRQRGDAVPEDGKIFLQGKHRKKSGPVIFGQIGSLQNMKKLQLDAPDAAGVQVADGLQHHFPRLAGKSQDHVDDDRDIRFT